MSVNKNPIEQAAESGDLDTLKNLLIGPNLNTAVLSNAFIKAAANGHLGVLKLLSTLRPKANHRALDDVAFQWAAANGHLEVLKFLLTLEPKVNHKAESSAPKEESDREDRGKKAGLQFGILRRAK